MCSIPPPAPPQPPPILQNVIISSKQETVNSNNNTTFIDPNVCQWASDQPELREACIRYNINLSKSPHRYKYKHFESIGQIGPTCGLVALSMLVNGEVKAEELLSIARKEGYSNNGEMLSCKSMVKLVEKVFSLVEIEDVRCTLKQGGLASDEMVARLLNGAILLVPYDADCNHSPCLRQGNTAHWAIVCGALVSEDPDDLTDTYPNIYALCKHGKSKYLTAWSLDVLDRSNKNLIHFSPKKLADGLIYVLPEGGLGGANGLRDQYLMFEGF